MAMEELFLQKKPKEIILYIKNQGKSNISEIASKTNSTYAHSYNIIKKFEENGLIVTNKHGRDKFIELTDKGKQIASIIEKISNILQGQTTISSKNNKNVKTPDNRLTFYQQKINIISKEIENINSLESEEKNKFKRILGRYRQIIRKMRPKYKEERALRKKILVEIEHILNKLE